MDDCARLAFCSDEVKISLRVSRLDFEVVLVDLTRSEEAYSFEAGHAKGKAYLLFTRCPGDVVAAWVGGELEEIVDRVGL